MTMRQVSSSMCINWIVSPTWVLGLTFRIYLALRVAFTPDMVKVSSSLIKIWFLGWDPSCQTIKYSRCYCPSTEGPWPRIRTPPSSHPIANIKQQQGNQCLSRPHWLLYWMVQKQGVDNVIVHILFLAHLVHALPPVSHHHGSLVCILNPKIPRIRLWSIFNLRFNTGCWTLPGI